MGLPAAPTEPAGQTHPLGWAPVGVGPGVTDDELARAFRRAARAARPDLRGDAAQVDRVQRADDQAPHCREVPGDGRQVPRPHGGHGTFPDRPRSWHLTMRLIVRTPAFAAKVHFALLVILCLALLTATGALGLGGALTITVGGKPWLAAPLAARPEWTEPVRHTGALFLYTSVVGIAVFAGEEIQAPLPPPRGQALYTATWALLVFVLAVVVWWTRSQARLASIRQLRAGERLLARQWYAAMKAVRPGQDEVWQVHSVAPMAGCTLCEVVHVVTGRCHRVLLPGWPPTLTYLVLDVDGRQRAWAPVGSHSAARSEWEDGLV